MVQPFLALLVAALVTLPGAQAYSIGAGCVSPGGRHEAGPNTAVAISIEDGQDMLYTGGGDPKSFTLKYADDSVFKGYVVEVRNAAGAYVGVLTGPRESQLMTRSRCPDAPATAGAVLTHTTAESRTSVDFSWEPPSSGSGNITLRGYLVKSLGQYDAFTLDANGTTLQTNVDLPDTAQASELSKVVFMVIAIVLVLLCGGLLRGLNPTSKLARTFLQRRIGAPTPATTEPSMLYTLKDFRVGELLVLLLLVGSFILQVLWNVSLYAGPEALPRALGGVALMLLAFVVLPIFKGPLWLGVLGIPFERALRFHRIIARLLVATAIVHMVSFAVVGVEIAAVDTESPIGNGSLFGLLTWICMQLMATTSGPRRKKNMYKIFRYVHMMYPLVLLFVTLHVRGAWKYWLPPTLIYVIDSIYQQVKRTRKVEVLSSEIISGATHLRLKSKKGKLDYGGGDYLMVTIDEISYLPHPFSISSAVGSDDFTLTIKAQGDGSFTDRLRKLVEDNKELSISVNGPYGSLGLRPADYSVVLLFAGGIGVTPMLSVISEMDASGNDWQHVAFHWYVPDRGAIEWGRTLLSKLSDKVEVHIYVTREEAGDKEGEGEGDGDGKGAINIHSGRTDVSEIFKATPAADLRAALACGPAALNQAVARAASDHGFDLHKETFEF
eukprot:PLAT5612.1.p1 GENE.PLAT5612.1~~PLAT5612.1.p1  ORF type:complete len:673 (-),score=276.99 PLAT5612.1:73-2070(-)